MTRQDVPSSPTRLSNQLRQQYLQQLLLVGDYELPYTPFRVCHRVHSLDEGIDSAWYSDTIYGVVLVTLDAAIEELERFAAKVLEIIPFACIWLLSDETRELPKGFMDVCWGGDAFLDFDYFLSEERVTS